jgi:ornithine cyclodeaminase/alanine dehydrogenase-like protein (mu-crystallin family)
VQVRLVTTPAREPVVSADWLRPGQHVTAVGADLPGKQELDPAVSARADKVVTDSVIQAVRSGDLHHAIAGGQFRRSDIYAELGEIAAGAKPGRTGDDELTVADLTGLGVEDAAMANLVAARLATGGAGQTIEI